MGSQIADLLAKRIRTQVKSDDDGRLVTFDASINATHAGSNEVTDYPIEDGANNSDHSRAKPRTLSLTAIISNTPATLGSVADIGVSPTERATRGKRGWEILEKWRQRGMFVRIKTEWFVYSNMMIMDVSTVRKPENSDGVEFDISFKQIFVATSQTASKPIRDVKPHQNAGKQSTKQVEPAQEAQSKTWLKTISDYAGKVISK